MKKILILFTIVFLSQISYSQVLLPTKEPKITKSEKDEFTNAIIKETNWVLLTRKVKGLVGEEYQFQIRQVNERYLLYVSYATYGTTSLVSGPSDPLMLKSDTLIKVYPKEISSGRFRTSQYGSSTTLVQVYYLNQSDIDYLKSHLVTKIRLYCSSEYLEADLKEENSQSLQQAIKLF